MWCCTSTFNSQVALLLGGLIFFVCFQLLQKSAFLVVPKSGNYAVLITVSKSAPKNGAMTFSEEARNFPGVLYGEPSLVKSENSDYVFLRITRNNHQNPDVNGAVSIIEHLLKDLDLNDYVEYAVLTDEGTLKATGSFQPRLFP